MFVVLENFDITFGYATSSQENMFIEKADVDVLYNQIINRYKTTKNSKNKYTDDFGGAFIDNNGVLNIGIVDDAEKINVLQDTGDIQSVNYKSVIFSYNYLQLLMDNIVDLMDNYKDICGVGISETYNYVFVELSNIDLKKIIIKYLEDLSIYNEKAIKFNNSDNHIMSLDGIANNGDSCSGQMTGTIATNALCNLTGKYGVITNDHIAPKNTAVYYGQELLGVSERSKKGGTVDAAFIPFSVQSSWQPSRGAVIENYSYNNIQLGSEDNIIEGQPLRKFGITTSNITGQILSCNYTFNMTTNGITTKYENVIVHSCLSKDGDSGGPVYYDDGNTLFLIGIHYGSRTSNGVFQQGYACRISEVMYELDVTPITNDPLPLLYEASGSNVKIFNRNNDSVTVTYSRQLCTEEAAKNFSGLSSSYTETKVIAANSYIEFTPITNLSNTFLTASYTFTGSNEDTYKLISYAEILDSGVDKTRVNTQLVRKTTYSTPRYLGFEVVSREGFLWYTWGIRITNGNPRSVNVSYNSRMCFKSDASTFSSNLTDLQDIRLYAHSSVLVTIQHNGTAGYITAAIVTSGSSNTKYITYANELSINPPSLTKYYKTVYYY